MTTNIVKMTDLSLRLSQFALEHLGDIPSRDIKAINHFTGALNRFARAGEHQDRLVAAWGGLGVALQMQTGVFAEEEGCLSDLTGLVGPIPA